MQRRNQVFFRDGALFEELLHQLVIAFRDQLHQLFMRFLSGRREVGRDFAFLAFTVATEFVGVGLHLDQVDDAGEALLLADRELQGNDCAPESTAE